MSSNLTTQIHEELEVVIARNISEIESFQSFGPSGLRSFALVLRSFTLICVLLHLTAFRTTAFGNFRPELPKRPCRTKNTARSKYAIDYGTLIYYLSKKGSRRSTYGERTKTPRHSNSLCFSIVVVFSVRLGPLGGPPCDPQESCLL